MDVVILAGGSGTRLWPVSQEALPKPFLPLLGEETLFQRSLKRALLLSPAGRILVVTQDKYLEESKKQAEKVPGSLGVQFLGEPVGRNTAPALALALSYLKEQRDEEDSLLFIMPADQLIAPEGAFVEKVMSVKPLAHPKRLVTFGVRPTKPEVGYGYVRLGAPLECGGFEVAAFVEKPALALAQQYVIEGNYLWNAGMLMGWRSHFEKLFFQHAPDIALAMWMGSEKMREPFDRLPSISIDYAILEKEGAIAIVPLELGWSDVGSWEAVYEALDKDPNHNVTFGNVKLLDTHNSLIMGGDKLISTIGVQDLMVVQTKEALLIVGKGHSQKVKAILNK